MRSARGQLREQRAPCRAPGRAEAAPAGRQAGWLHGRALARAHAGATRPSVLPACSPLHAWCSAIRWTTSIGLSFLQRTLLKAWSMPQTRIWCQRHIRCRAMAMQPKSGTVLYLVCLRPPEFRFHIVINACHPFGLSENQLWAGNYRKHPPESFQSVGPF